MSRFKACENQAWPSNMCRDDLPFLCILQRRRVRYGSILPVENSTIGTAGTLTCQSFNLFDPPLIHFAIDLGGIVILDIAALPDTLSPSHWLRHVSLIVRPTVFALSFSGRMPMSEVSIARSDRYADSVVILTPQGFPAPLRANKGSRARFL